VSHISFDASTKIEHLREAIGLLVVRHDALRSRLPISIGNRSLDIVIVEDDAPFIINLEIIEAATGSDSRDLAIREFDNSHLDCEQSLAKCRIVKSSEEVLVCIMIHRAIADFESGEILERELRALVDDRQADLPACGQVFTGDSIGSGSRHARDLHFFQKRLEGASARPAFFPMRISADATDSLVIIHDDNGLSRALAAAAKQARVTEHALVVAAMSALVSLYLDRHELTVQTVISFREFQGISAATISNMTRWMYVHMSGESSDTLLARSRRACSEIFNGLGHILTPPPIVEQWVHENCVQRGIYPGLAAIAINYMKFQESQSELDADSAADPVPAGRVSPYISTEPTGAVSGWELVLEVHQRNSSVQMRLWVGPSLTRLRTPELVARDLVTIIDEIVRRPSIRVADIAVSKLQHDKSWPMIDGALIDPDIVSEWIKTTAGVHDVVVSVFVENDRSHLAADITVCAELSGLDAREFRRELYRTVADFRGVRMPEKIVFHQCNECECAPAARLSPTPSLDAALPCTW